MANTINLLVSPLTTVDPLVGPGEAMTWVMCHDKPKKASVTSTTRTAEMAWPRVVEAPESRQPRWRTPTGTYQKGEGREAQHGRDEQRPAPGQEADTSSDSFEVLGVELSDHTSSPEKSGAFCRRVGEHVQEHPGYRQRRREAHADRQDPHVLDRRVGKQALEVSLGRQVQGTQEERRHPKPASTSRAKGRQRLVR